MARPLRLHVPNGFYHITLRGNHRQAIFRRDADRDLLDGIVSRTARELGARVHAYCWMTNHIHALIQVSDAPLGKIVLRVASQYARKFQAGIETTGHLFERRHHAVLVDADSYLLALIRYIHLNPVRAGLVSDPGAYPWSSHREYLGLRRSGWVCTSFALEMLSRDATRARSRYAEWINAPGVPKWGEGSLVPHPENPQVLGDDRFLARIGASAAPVSARVTIDELLLTCARRFGLSAESIASSSRSRALSTARAWLFHEASARGLLTVNALARQFGRSEGAIRGMMRRHPSDEI